MKNKNNNFVKNIRTLTLILVIAFSTSLNAADPGVPQGPPPGATDTNDSGDSIPLDGGLAVLLAGAAIFGIRKLRGAKQK